MFVSKPEVFKGDTKESLDSSIGHMNLYVAKVPDDQKLSVAVSFLGGHAFDWFKVVNQVEKVQS